MKFTKASIKTDFMLSMRNLAQLDRLSSLTNEMLSDSKCDEFASFFSEINNIRKAISTSSSYAEVRQIRPQSQKQVTMSAFEAIDSNILVEIVQHLNSSTCYPDTLPTSFFKGVLDLLEVVNASLFCGGCLQTP